MKECSNNKLIINVGREKDDTHFNHIDIYIPKKQLIIKIKDIYDMMYYHSQQKVFVSDHDTIGDINISLKSSQSDSTG